LTFFLVISTFDYPIITIDAIIMKPLYLKIVAVALLFISLTGIQAQKVNIDVARLRCPHITDGVEEEIWNDVDPVYLERNIGTEKPTVSAYWKALWDPDNIYVLIHVEDDDHYPAWESGGAIWDYDRPEIYFDVNEVLNDGLGPAYASSGHYQFSPGFDQDGYGILHEAAGTAQSPGGQYAYDLTGESYVYEFAVTISSMSNNVEDAMDCMTNWIGIVGFDVTVIDQDEGFTTARQRKIWQSGNGSEAEAWNNMDSCGTITFIGPCYSDCWGDSCDWDYCGNRINDVKTMNVAVLPNPVTDFLTIHADFDKVIITNILGQEISSINKIRTNKLDVGYLSKGVFFIKVYKGERYIGAARIMKI
jgi:hypothetical protein